MFPPPLWLTSGALSSPLSFILGSRLPLVTDSLFFIKKTKLRTRAVFWEQKAAAEDGGMEGAAPEGLSGEQRQVRGARAVQGQTVSSAAPAAHPEPTLQPFPHPSPTHAVPCWAAAVPAVPNPVPHVRGRVHSWRTEFLERPYGHPQPGHPLPQSHNSPVWGSPRGLLSPRPCLPARTRPLLPSPLPSPSPPLRWVFPAGSKLRRALRPAPTPTGSLSCSHPNPDGAPSCRPPTAPPGTTLPSQVPCALAFCATCLHR